MKDVSTAPPPAARRRIRKKPVDRRLDILQAAYRLLIEDGYPAFSLRQVAVRCSIRLGTVQHHFHDRATLLEALVQFVVSDYTAKLDQISAATDLSAPERLRFMIAYLLEDNRRAETSGFMLELWAMAHRDAAAARSMAYVSQHGISMISGLIADARPALDARQITELATIVIAAIDGLLLTYGYGKEPPANLGPESLTDMELMLVRIALADT